MIISSQTGLKRKHKSSFSSDDKDSVITTQPPLAKRHHVDGAIYRGDEVPVRPLSHPSSSHHPLKEYDLKNHRVKVAKKDYMVYSPTTFKSISNNSIASCKPNKNSCEDKQDDEKLQIVDNPKITNYCLYDCSYVSNQPRWANVNTCYSLQHTNVTQVSSVQISQKVDSYVKTTRKKNEDYQFVESPNKSLPDTIISNQAKYLDSELLSITNGPHYLNCMTPGTDTDSASTSVRPCPLPALAWANSHDVWQLMCKKDDDASCMRNSSMLDKHPGLQPRMRSILLDWLIEVCEVYKLHRETYYLAVDYLDRYLSVQEKIQKTHLQLIGITCLFIAAKVEEIYPPKIGEFAYVTDGACQEVDILQHEILLLQALDWNISPVTPMGWLGVYMQLHVNNRSPRSLSQTKNSLQTHSKTQVKTKKSQQEETKKWHQEEIKKCQQEDTKKCHINQFCEKVDESFIYPQFSAWEFCQTAKLLDLCSLDLGFADFSYSVITAAALTYTFNKDIALQCSGLNWHTIEPCVKWMEPFFYVIYEEANNMQIVETNEQVNSTFGLSHICPNILTDDSHIIQNHAITLNLFERAEHRSLNAHKLQAEMSPATALKYPEGLLTPPASSRKILNPADDDEDPQQNVLKIRVVRSSSPGV